jgi:hypothetical protein
MQAARHAAAGLLGRTLPSKRHPEYNEHEYFLAVEASFAHWEAMQNVGR